MDRKIQDVLSEIEEFGRVNDSAEAAHSRKMLNLEIETAKLLSILLTSSRSKSVLEIGTSNGYSTIWIAASVRSHGGHVFSVDRSPEKHALAAENLRKAGLLNDVSLITGDATAKVRNLPGPWDAVFFDADRISAPEQLRLVYPKLAPSAFLLADNALSHPDEIRSYLDAVSLLRDFTHVILPVGKGLSVAFRPEVRV
jgi:predicted O-methyltransferase YrrM